MTEPGLPSGTPDRTGAPGTGAVKTGAMGTGAVRALLGEIIDYAGSFPPASLPLLDALHNYGAYASSTWSWMLARFVCPASRLADLSDHIRSLDASSPAAFSILASGGETVERFLTALETDCENAARFRRRHGSEVRIEQAEVRLPSSVQDADEATLLRLFHQIRQTLERTELCKLDFFLEIPLDARVDRMLPGLLRTVRACNADGAGRFGIKIRTGGATAGDVPAVGDVARVITSCRDAAVPFKATAGLHHSVRQFDGAVGTHVHGFLNVFIASVLAGAHHLDDVSVAAVLTDEDVDHFVLGETHVGWTDLAASVSQIERARRTLALSFGSCSFTEPINDLRALGFL